MVSAPTRPLNESRLHRWSSRVLRFGSIPMSTPRRIVLIDDDPRVRDATQFALMDLGFVVDAAADWAAAEAQLEAPADLVVTDLQMPGLADAVIVERLRTRAPHTPIIALSAGGDAIGSAALAFGADAF